MDFDWFREEPIDDPLRLAADLRAADLRFETGRVERGTLHGRASGVRVSFLEYGYPLLKPPREIEGLRLAALEDIAAMKRQSWPDVKATIRGWLAGATRGRR